ncbi:14116_t:CDS:1, partial [Entrophospora sp. SA101]
MYNDFHNPPISPLPKHSLYDSYSPRNSSYSTTSISNTTDNGNSNNGDDKENGEGIDEIERLIKTFNMPLKKKPILYGFYNNNAHN